MSNLNRNEVTRQVGVYFDFPDQRPVVLDFFLEALADLADDEIEHQKLTLLPHERRSEASWAVIQAISFWDHNQASTFENDFIYWFRKGLRLLKPRKDHVPIEGLSIEDPTGNPESIYIVKEQMELLKEFLSKHYDPVTVDQFMRRYADNETFAEIANEYSVTTSSLIPKLKNIMDRVSKYMKRINNG